MRKSLLEPLLDVSAKFNDPIIERLVSQMKMVLAYTGMTALREAYEFASECATAAHTHIKIVRQSIALERLFDAQYTHDVQFHYLLEGQGTDWEVANYKELVFCAIYQRKIANIGSSWDNFKIKSSDLSPSRMVLETSVRTILKGVSALTGNLEQEVTDYLKKKGKEYDDKVQPYQVQQVGITVPGIL